MLSAITIFIEMAISKVVDRSIDVGRKKINMRRSLLAKLLVIYDSLHDLRTISQNTFEEFDRYAQAVDTATIVVSSRHLEEILKKFTIFRDTVSEIERVMEIYEPNLRVSLLGAHSGKGPIILGIIDLAQQITPQLLVENGRKTFIVLEPVTVPNFEEFRFHDEFRRDNSTVSSLTEFALNKIRESVEYVEFDIKDKNRLSAALIIAKQNIEKMDAAKLEVQKAIKNNFSIDQVFEQLN